MKTKYVIEKILLHSVSDDTQKVLEKMAKRTEMKRPDKSFTILKFKNDRSKLLGRYAMPINIGDRMEWVGCCTPQLMVSKTTLKTLKNFYPKLDFKNIKIVNVSLNENETK